MAETIGFTGDVMLGRVVNEYQRHRAPEAVWGDLLDRLQGLDGLFMNLECCLSTRGRPWNRTYRPFHFRADPAWAIPALNAIDVDCCALANNHVLDYGTAALIDTLEVLEQNEIQYAGAGHDIDKARRPAIVDSKDLTIGFISVTDNTPEYAATNQSPGTAHVAISTDNQQTKQLLNSNIRILQEANVGVIVASLHWGPNMVERPPEQFQRFARWLIDGGVDIVHGHSAHIFQGIEIYQDRLILYDTGDFVDDYAIDPAVRNDRSFLFEVSVESGGHLTEVILRPTQIEDCAVHAATENTAHWARDRMQQLSAQFNTPFDVNEDLLVASIGD